MQVGLAFSSLMFESAKCNMHFFQERMAKQ